MDQQQALDFKQKANTKEEKKIRYGVKFK